LISAFIGNALLLENIIRMPGNGSDGSPVDSPAGVQVTLSGRVNPAISGSLATSVKLHVLILPMKSAKSNDWSLSAEGPLLRVGQGQFVACAEARPILAFLAATPFAASTGFFDFQARLFIQEGRAFFLPAARTRRSVSFPRGRRIDITGSACRKLGRIRRKIRLGEGSE
jgi:hypothetical protein